MYTFKGDEDFIFAQAKILFPKLFDYPKPLAIGAGKEIINALLNNDLMLLTYGNRTQARKRINRFLQVLTQKTAYLNAMLADDAMRYDTQGNPVEPVFDLAKQKAKLDLNNKIQRKKGRANV